MKKRNSRRDPWSEAWASRYPQSAPAHRRRFRPRLPGRGAGRYAVVSAIILALAGSSFAVAAATGRFTSNDPRYTVLARNTRTGDGGAVAAACNSNASTASAAHEPCMNLVNKGTGYAGAFRTRGLVGFLVQTSGAGTATPFALSPNATGKVDHLNADMVDGLSASQIQQHATHADTADRATAADNGVPAYAHVLANGGATPTLDAARTAGFSDVRRVSTEHYCLTPSSGTPPESGRPAVAQLDTTDTNIDVYTRVVVGAPDCNTGEYEVTTPNAGDSTNFNVVVG